MRAFTRLSGIVAPLDRANVDTDAIIPKQFLKSVERTGFGPNLFDAWRYLDVAEGAAGSRRENPDFVLNQAPYRQASILLARANFGCGSSREHAPWALLDFGIRVVVAPSFADIFYGNCLKNGLLPVVLAAAEVDALFGLCAHVVGCVLGVDLEAQCVTTPDGTRMHFDIDAFRKKCLLEGLDEIGLTLQCRAEITAYESKRRLEAPWLFEQ